MLSHTLYKICVEYGHLAQKAQNSSLGEKGGSEVRKECERGKDILLAGFYYYTYYM